MSPTLFAVLGGLVPLIGWTLAHFLWQGALIALVLELALRATRTPKARHDVCLLALIVMAALPVATFLWLMGQVQVVVAPTRLPGLRGMTELSWETLAVAGWLVGVAALALRTLGGLVLIERLRRRALPLDAAWTERCRSLNRRMGGRLKVTFAQSAAIAAPLVAGWLRPMVLIPTAALIHLPVDQLEALVLHELAHVRRFDAFANLLQATVETALFYHPAVWWVSRRLRQEREHCCDDLAVQVIRDPAVFVRALQAMETLRPALRTPHGAGVLAADGGSLKARAARLLGLTTERPALSKGGAIMVLGLAVAAMAAGLQVQAEPTPQAPPPLKIAQVAPRNAPVVETAPVVKPVIYVAAPVSGAKSADPAASQPPPPAGPDIENDMRAAFERILANRKALGDPPKDDPMALAAWKARDFALTAEDDQLISSKQKTTIENSRRGLAASASDPAEKVRRFNQLEMLDFVVHAQGLRGLHLRAAGDAAAAFTAIASAKTPEDLASAKAKAADAEQAVKVLDTALQDEFELSATRFQGGRSERLSTIMHEVGPPKDMPPPPANGVAFGDTLSGAGAAERAGRPVGALDYLEDAMRDGQIRAAEAEKAFRRRTHTPPPASLTMAQFDALTERVRLESIALNAIRDEVEAGHRPAVDLDAAKSNLAAAQAEATAALEQARRTPPAEARVLNQRHLATAAAYRAHVDMIERRRPRLSPAERAEADRALMRLRYEVLVEERMAADALKPHPKPGPLKVKFPSAENATGVRIEED